MKRFQFFLLLFFHALSSMAVLNERNLEQTISVLRTELQYSKQEQEDTQKWYNTISNAQHDRIIKIMQQSEEVSLMLYSQKQEYTFDLTYACHEATSLYDEFESRRLPFDKILNKLKIEIERYNNLIEVLEKLPPRLKKNTVLPDSIKNRLHVRMDETGEVDSLTHSQIVHQLTDSIKRRPHPYTLSAEAQEDRDTCLSLAEGIKTSLITMFNKISEDSEHYEFLEQKLKKSNDYALVRYNYIKQLIFRNGGDNYIAILRTLPMHISHAKKEIQEKYYQPQDSKVRSEWRGPIVVGLAFFIVFYLIVAMTISFLIIRFAVPDKYKKTAIRQKGFYITLAGAVILFAIIVMIMRGMMTHHFFLMASNILIEYSMLVAAVLFSLLFRVNDSQIRSSFSIYTPVLLTGFVIIVFRIIFISNSVVNLVFPPILLLFTIWQYFVIARHNKNIPFIDIAYTYMSLLIMAVSCIASWIGYTLLSVQLLIWWLFQLTAIQAITCIYDILKKYEFKHLTKKILKRDDINMFAAARKAENIMNEQQKKKGDHLDLTWFYDLMRMTLLPIVFALSLIFCVWMSADIFDLTEYCRNLFVKNFINIEGICQLSFQKIVTVVVLFFSFRFINYVGKSIYKKYRSHYADANGDANIALANNIIAILVWGLFFIIVLVMLRIPKSGISIVTAGLATGLGFAMKDILENFIYGLSLMAGRVRVGDYIECDGIRGRVDSITYQSTQILTLDGCVIAFLNSSLFSKNFKNLTRNHGYEFTKLKVGVAYGTDVEHVRNLLKKALEVLYDYEKSGVPSIDKEKGINVLLNQLGDSSVDLYITLWALVEDKFRITGVAKEIVYNTLNENNIEIPFPQRTVYIKKD